jgi:L-ascorbate metabolism protein UlaG (beta-lactamase superfamily)
MRLRWLGTAGFELTSDAGTVLLIDPYLSRPPRAKPQSPIRLSDISQADAIFVSHGHFDHALDAPALVQRLDTTVYASTSVCRTLARQGTQPTHLSPLASGETVQIKDVKVRTLPARHIHFDAVLVLRTLPRLLSRLRSLCPLLVGWPAGQAFGYQIISSNLSLVHFGSAGWTRDSLQGVQADVALIPVQGHSAIAHIAARLAALLRPRLVVAHHWDDFYPPISRPISLIPFAQALSRDVPGARLHIPAMGDPWHIS